jgi:hypothetical protein
MAANGGSGTLDTAKLQEQLIGMRCHGNRSSEGNCTSLLRLFPLVQTINELFFPSYNSGTVSSSGAQYGIDGKCRKQSDWPRTPAGRLATAQTKVAEAADKAREKAAVRIHNKSGARGGGFSEWLERFWDGRRM